MSINAPKFGSIYVVDVEYSNPNAIEQHVSAVDDKVIPEDRSRIQDFDNGMMNHLYNNTLMSSLGKKLGIDAKHVDVFLRQDGDRVTQVLYATDDEKGSHGTQLTERLIRPHSGLLGRISRFPLLGHWFITLPMEAWATHQAKNQAEPPIRFVVDDVSFDGDRYDTNRFGEPLFEIDGYVDGETAVK